MNATLTRPDDTAHAPEPFRAAMAELVGIGMSVARLVGRAAEAEMAIAEAASQAIAADGVSPLANSLAEAIEADKATAAAAEARLTVVARTEIVATSFAQVARAVRRTVLLAERLDRGWARRSVADDRHAMARRQIARGVADAIERVADPARAEQLTDALAERMDSPDTLDEIGTRPAEEIIADICRELGVDPARMGPLIPDDSLSRSSRERAGVRAAWPPDSKLGPHSHPHPDPLPPAGEGEGSEVTPSRARPPPDRTSPHR
jgi:hypothetical protein